MIGEDGHIFFDIRKSYAASEMGGKPGYAAHLLRYKEIVPKTIYVRTLLSPLMLKKIIVLLAVLLLFPVPAVQIMNGENEGGLFPHPETPITFDGRYINISFDSEKNVVRVSVYGVPVVSALCLPSADFVSSADMNGSFVLSSDRYVLTVSDYSSPSITYKGMYGQRISVSMEEGVDLHMEGSSVILEKEGVTGEIFAGSGISMSDGCVYISVERNGLFQMRFSRQENGTAGNAVKAALSNAFSLHRVGAEAFFDSSGFSYVSYNNISIKPVKIQKKEIEMSVVSNDSTGRSILLHLGPANLTNISVLLDGVPVEKGSYYDALFSTGDRAVWNSTGTGSNLTIILYVPHFSEHSVVIREVSSGGALLSPSPVRQQSALPPILVAVLLSALAAAALFYNRRKRTF